MKLLTRMTYKLLVTSMIAITLSFFVVTPYSHANKFQDLINDDGFYYTGTQDGNLTVPASMFEKIINALSEIAGYLLGIIGLALRGVGIGWIEIAEMILTSILDTENGFFDVLGSSLDNYSQNVVNVETIIFNRVGILNANIFEEIDADTDLQEKTKENDSNCCGKMVLRFAFGFHCVYVGFVDISWYQNGAIFCDCRKGANEANACRLGSWHDIGIFDSLYHACNFWCQ